MRHLLKGRKFSRDKDARKALFRSLATSLFEHGRISTTSAKAKDLRPVVEKLVTVAKNGKSNLSAIRSLSSVLFTKKAIENAFVFADLSKSRNGGYLRIIKCSTRSGDCAPVSIIEFVDQPQVESSVASVKS